MAAPSGKGGKRVHAQVDPPPAPSPKARSQNAKRKERNQWQKEENDKLRQQLANANKRHNNGCGGGAPQNPTGGGGGGGGGGGARGGTGGKDGKAGKGGKPQILQGAKTKTADSRPICFAWNQGTCTRNPCNFAHVCWICESAHPGKDHA